jgi:hypothetical protein
MLITNSEKKKALIDRYPTIEQKLQFVAMYARVEDKLKVRNSNL